MREKESRVRTTPKCLLGETFLIQTADPDIVLHPVLSWQFFWWWDQPGHTLWGKNVFSYIQHWPQKTEILICWLQFSFCSGLGLLVSWTPLCEKGNCQMLCSSSLTFWWLGDSSGCCLTLCSLSVISLIFMFTCRRSYDTFKLTLFSTYMLPRSFLSGS